MLCVPLYIYIHKFAFDRPYLSYNDHCDRWLFQEIFFYYFQRQPYVEMFFKTGVIWNFAIFTRQHLCWSLMACNFISNSSQKRLPMKIAKSLQFLLWNISSGCFCQFVRVTVQWWASADLLFLIKNKIYGMVPTKEVCRSGQSMLFTCHLLVETIPICFYWLTCRKQKLVQSKALQQRLFVLILEILTL